MTSLRSIRLVSGDASVPQTTILEPNLLILIRLYQFLFLSVFFDLNLFDWDDSELLICGDLWCFCGWQLYLGRYLMLLVKMLNHFYFVHLFVIVH